MSTSYTLRLTAGTSGGVDGLSAGGRTQVFLLADQAIHSQEVTR
ncbi:MAG: hypothetical protein ACRDJ3_00910 [Solirubrobacteraceae bacterium]